MNKFSKILGGVTAGVVAAVSPEAIEVKTFSAKIYEETNVSELIEKDLYLTIAVKVFQDSLRLHYDELRAKENPSDLLRTDNYKYFLTLYDVIPTEIAKMAFNIKVWNDSVNYVNKKDIIECISEWNNNYKSIKDYDQSNWNYLLLINVLNQIKYENEKIDNKLIYKVADKISKNSKYSQYSGELFNAANDIVKYFDELRLYDYLTSLKNFTTGDVVNKFKEIVLKQQSVPFVNLTMTGIAADNPEEQGFDVVLEKPGGIETWRYTFEKVSNKFKMIVYKYYMMLGDDKCSIIQHNFAGNDVIKREIQKIQLKNNVSLYELLTYDADRVIQHNAQRLTDTYTALLKKAQESALETDEQIFIELYNSYLYYSFLFEGTPTYFFSPNDQMLTQAKSLIERLDDYLFKFFKSNKISTVNKFFKEIMEKILFPVMNRYD